MLNMLAQTHEMVWEQSEENLGTALKIRKFMSGIINVGRRDGYPREFYIAMLIIVKSMFKMFEVDQKWQEANGIKEEENENGGNGRGDKGTEQVAQ